MNIVVSGYTYTRQNLFDVFESYPEREHLFFILPSNWTAKHGKVVFKPFTRKGFHIFHSPAFFTHSQYPVIGGLLKGWMPLFVVRLAWIRFTKGVDILFTTGEPNVLSTLYNAFWAKLFGMKHVFHYWENIPYKEKDRGLRYRLKQWIIRATLALSDGAICGMHKAERILKSFGSDIAIGTFLHAGFDVQRFRPGINHEDVSRQYGLTGSKVFLFIGALGKRKGIHIALRALARMKGEYAVKFLIVGSGEYESELRALVDSLGLQSEVIFVPWITENEKLPALYNAADVFLYPSIPLDGWEEQFGYSIAEASLCGVPVISTHTGSIDEVLLDQKTGIMVPPNDEDALYAAMVALVQNPERARQYGANGREYIVSHFSNEVISKKMFSLFHDVAKR